MHGFVLHTKYIFPEMFELKHFMFNVLKRIFSYITLCYIQSAFFLKCLNFNISCLMFSYNHFHTWLCTASYATMDQFDIFWTPLSAYCDPSDFPDALGQRLSSKILSTESSISLQKERKNMYLLVTILWMIYTNMMVDISWLPKGFSTYMTT